MITTRIPNAGVLLLALLSVNGVALAQGGPGQQPRPPVTIPRAPDRGEVRITGRVVAEGARQPARNTEVRIETTGGSFIAFAFTDASGSFEFRAVRLEPNESYVVAVDADGFEPFSDRLDYQVDRRFGGNLTVLLEAARPVGTPEGGDSPVVDLSQLMAEIPEDARREYAEAIRRVESGDHEDAVERLERAVRLAPDYFDAYDALGAEYVVLDRYREGEAALSRARELSPGSARPLMSLGSLYYKEGEGQLRAGMTAEAAATFARAAELLDEAVRRDPFVPLAHQNLGAVLYRVQDYAAAESSLHRALDLDPDLHDVRLLLVNVYTRQLRYDAAVEQIHAYLESNPESPQRPTLERLLGQLTTPR